MRRIGRYAPLAALGLTATLVWPLAAAAQSGEAVLAIERPSGAMRAGGEPAPFQVNVRGVANLGGFEFILTFDSDIFEFDRLEQGSFLGSTGREVICDDPQSEAGAVRLLCVTLTPDPAGAAGDGTLATVWLRPKHEGATEVKLSRHKLTTVSADEIQAAMEGASVRVGDDGGTHWLVWAGLAAIGAAIVAVLVAVVARGRGVRSGPGAW